MSGKLSQGEIERITSKFAYTYDDPVARNLAEEGLLLLGHITVLEVDRDVLQQALDAVVEDYDAARELVATLESKSAVEKDMGIVAE